MFLIYSFVAGAALFALISKFKKSILVLSSVLLEKDNFGDFMEFFAF